MSMQLPGDLSESGAESGATPPLTPPSSGEHPTSWGRRTQPFTRRVVVPDLTRFQDEPRYDMATLVQLVGVRAPTLWSWEQQLGISQGENSSESSTATRFSERHLVALIWLRDQIISGTEPATAVQQVRDALTRARHATPSSLPTINSSPSVPLSFLSPSVPLSSLSPSVPLSSLPPQAVPSYPPQAMPAPPSSQRPISRPLTPDSGRLGAQSVNISATKRDPGSYVPLLLQAFAAFDTARVSRILDEAFAVRSIETVCVTLISQTLARINDTWLHRDGSLHPEAIYAVTQFRARLYRYFDLTMERAEAPLTFVACGPDALHELDALMLALFWRRIGLRVIYFGQYVDSMLLTERVKQYHPHVVGITINSTSRLRTVGRFIKEVDRLGMTPSTIVGLMGHSPSLNDIWPRKVGGVNLGQNPAQATQYVQQILRSRNVVG
jgi:hypothetical protein